MKSMPEELVAEFRRVAVGRLQRIERAWEQLKEAADDGAAQALQRELHTLKGEAQMLGFSDVHLVCHKLEDLFEFAHSRGFAVRDDVDNVIVMAIQFTGMLTRKRIGHNVAGVDLPGFIRDIDKTLRESRQDFTGGGRMRTTGLTVGLVPTAEALSPTLRAKLAPPAADTFVEYATAKGTRRNRLRGTWHAMRDVVGLHRATLSAHQLDKHRAGAEQVATALGKEVSITFDVPATEVTTEIVAALDQVVLHVIRNAVDHGIESPAERVTAGKPPAGRIQVACRTGEGALLVTISDDGAGIDFERVRARALALQLIDATTAITNVWVDILTQPGFSTRDAASDVSGRGIGLDAARVAIASVGGSLSGKTAPGQGVTWIVRVPLPRMVVSGYLLKVAGLPFPVMLEGWDARPTEGQVMTLDIAQILGLSDAPPTGTALQTFVRGSHAIAIPIETSPQMAHARCLVVTGEKGLFDIILLDAREGIAIRPEVLL